jgi:dinuclear metal center YbgI/SA1388 family protein
MNRNEVVSYLDDYLQIRTIEDRSNNGLQVEGADEVTRVAFAVDAGLAAFKGAQTAGAQMLIVHHGLFWNEPVLITGIHRRRLGHLFDSDLSLYAAHLPLDFHDDVGNNATLARWLGLEEVAPFGSYNGRSAGVTGRLPQAIPLEQFTARVEEALGEAVVRVWPFGPALVQRVGIASGGGSFLVAQVAKMGVDVYLTGEMNHNVYHMVQELGLNVIYGGHYATETAGLKALAEHLAARFGLETVFVDLPTGA